jgi:hypothetical protein
MLILKKPRWFHKKINKLRNYYKWKIILQSIAKIKVQKLTMKVFYWEILKIKINKWVSKINFMQISNKMDFMVISIKLTIKISKSNNTNLKILLMFSMLKK